MLSHQVLALWATPRSRSTAFGRMMAARGDFRTLHEPFQQCAYLSEDRLFRRFEPVPEAMGFDAVLSALVNAARTTPVFIKDHAYYIEHLASPEFLSSFESTFLIRHPSEALPSYHALWSDLTLRETGYLEQARLFDAVVRLTGRIPAVIDGDDLVTDGEAVVRGYCERVGIDFIEAALRWEPRAPNESAWHEHLRTTDGFVEQTERAYVPVEEDPHLRSLYAECLPAYLHLHRHRIAPTTPRLRGAA